MILALTGLNITFGKFVLMPVIGPDNFAVVSQLAKYVHNFTSFAFVTGMVLIVAMWIRDNVPRRVDIEWIKEGGGFIKRSIRPRAGSTRAKKWCSGFAWAGIAVIATGFLLLFPFYVANIFGMQIAQGIHAIIAMLFIALILAHIYIGTIGMEGAFEAMGKGTVDLNWAKEHHSLWLEQGRGQDPSQKANRPRRQPNDLEGVFDVLNRKRLHAPCNSNEFRGEPWYSPRPLSSGSRGSTTARNDADSPVDNSHDRSATTSMTNIFMESLLVAGKPSHCG